MKDKHTINLIRISSKRVLPSFRVCSWCINSSSKCFHFFLFRSSNFLGHFVGTSIQIIARLILFFHPSFLSHHLFVTGVLHGGSSWFNSFFKSSSRFLLVGFKYFFLLASRSANNSSFSSEVEFCISSFFSDIQAFGCGIISPQVFWVVLDKTTTSLFFSLLIFSTTPFNPSKFFSFNSFNSFGGIALFISSSAIPSCEVQVSFPSMFSRSAA